MPVASIARPIRSTHGVDFADDLALGDTADGWITRHLTHRVQIGGQQGRFRTQTGGGGGGFSSGMAGTDHDDVVLIADNAHFRIIRMRLIAGRDCRGEILQETATFLPNRSSMAGCVNKSMRPVKLGSEQGSDTDQATTSKRVLRASGV